MGIDVGKQLRESVKTVSDTSAKLIFGIYLPVECLKDLFEWINGKLIERLCLAANHGSEEV